MGHRRDFLQSTAFYQFRFFNDRFEPDRSDHYLSRGCRTGSAIDRERAIANPVERALDDAIVSLDLRLRLALLSGSDRGSSIAFALVQCCRRSRDCISLSIRRGRGFGRHRRLEGCEQRRRRLASLRLSGGLLVSLDSRSGVRTSFAVNGAAVEAEARQLSLNADDEGGICRCRCRRGRWSDSRGRHRRKPR